MSSESSDDGPSDLFILHEAADAGDVDALKQLLVEERAQQLAARAAQMETDEEGGPAPALGPADDPFLQAKDQNECTPLHIALLRGHVECARVLVEAQADVDADCDGCPALHLAACTGALPGREGAAAALVQLLLEAGADPLARDDSGRMALHWAAELGLAEACSVLLGATAAAAAALTERVEAQGAGEGEGEGGQQPQQLEAPNVLEMQDNDGNNVLHVAARFNQDAALRVLLEAKGQDGAAAPGADAGAAAAATNKAGLTPLGLAARHGAAAASAALLRAQPRAAHDAADKHGLTPAQHASRRGFDALAAALRQPDAAAAAAAAAEAAAAPGGAPRAAPTLVVAPPECELHLTCPDPLPRGIAPPPENVERLRVLVSPVRGILRGRGLAGRLAWETSVAPAPIGDVLRVHDWNYVRGLQMACAAIPDEPDSIAHLDPDTAVSHHTFQVALRAASAVCVAIDRVVAGSAANAFCAVRPPGHHAGPRGVVPSKKDRNGSHGFCLLNNVAIGAAYAMNVHRHRGIQRVAILDFDVHHGNGTRACVSNTAPGVVRVPFQTGLSEGVHVYHTYAPWFDADDDDNILFASVQGYGPKSASRPDVFVYPGSGATTDTQLLKEQQQRQQDQQRQQQQAQPAAAAAAPDGAAADGTAVKAEQQQPQQPKQPQPQQADGAGKPPQQPDQQQQANGVEAPAQPHSSLVEEDPDHEFPPSTADDPPLSGPRLIEVGIPGPGGHPGLWRRAWRDKVLPAVANFKPDLIMLSAGFDAHRKDEINFRYIGVTEADYEWLTDQVVQVANKCCGGRVVSVLEGGYNINGGLISAFARSVEAHVRGLAEPHSQAWDPDEARAERTEERRRREERAARIAAKRAAAVARLAQIQAAEAAAAAAAGDGGGEGGAAGGRSKRRRTGAAVDYAALNAQLLANAGGAGAAEAGAAEAAAPAPAPADVP